MIDWVFLLIASVSLIVFSYTDLKTREVPDKPVHCLILLALLLNFLLRPLDIAVNVLIITILVSAFFFILYLFGQIGGGDVKLIALLILLIPYYPSGFPLLTNTMHTSLPFILPLFLLAGLIGPMFVIPCYYFYKLVKERERIIDKKTKAIKGLVYSILLLPFAFLWFGINSYIGLLFIPVILSIWMIVFKEDVLKLFCLENKNIKNLNDDDVIAFEFLDNKTRKKLGLWHKTLTVIELSRIKEKAREEKVAKIPVLEHLPPFVPFLLISLIINLLFGDFLLLLLGGVAV